MICRAIIVLFLCFGATAAKAARLDSLSCATYLIGLQKEHSVDSHSRAQTASILREHLIPFRKTLYPEVVAPSSEPLEVTGPHATNTQKEQVAARLVGIEESFLNRGLDDSGKNRNVMMASAVTGRKQVAEFFNALAELREVIDESGDRESARVRREAEELLETDPKAAGEMIDEDRHYKSYKNAVSDFRWRLFPLIAIPRLVAFTTAVTLPLREFLSSHDSSFFSTAFLGAVATGSMLYTWKSFVERTKETARRNWLGSTHFAETKKLLTDSPSPGYWSIRSENYELPKEFIKYLLVSAGISKGDPLLYGALERAAANEAIRSNPLTIKAWLKLLNLSGNKNAPSVSAAKDMFFDTAPIFMDLISAVNDQGEPSVILVLRTSYSDPQPDLPEAKHEKSKPLAEPEPSF